MNVPWQGRGSTTSVASGRLRALGMAHSLAHMGSGRPGSATVEPTGSPRRVPYGLTVRDQHFAPTRA
jgi:hypothetical protein